jgi:PhzF family phenazine biosynthesis protein
LAETAFLTPGDVGYSLRWFTPTTEVDLCGHATLASAHILWTTGRSESDTISFHTRSGELTATRREGRIVLDFPSTPASETPAPPALIEALGAIPQWVGKSVFDYLAVFEQADQVRGLEPDFRQLATVGARGVCATAISDVDKYDYISRYFAPSFGIDEDPVTGSAHCMSGPFWSDRLGKGDLVAYQASARGGVVGVGVRGGRVELAGNAVTVLQGELTC